MELPAALLDAVREGDAARLATVLRERPGLVRAADQHAKTALHWAAELDRVEVAELLIQAGADLEARTAWGASPFDWAATMGSARVAELLLAKGATGLNLITAAALGRHNAVRDFVEAGSDLSRHRRRDAPRMPDDHWPADSAHARGDVLSDALYAAARNGHREVVEYLLDQGADVNTRGVFGATALQWAAFNGHPEVVELLLARGADPDLRDSRFDADAAGWAHEGGHGNIVALLRAG